jgi:L-aspartate oxidase
MRAELAPRDIVSRSIFSEMKKTNTNFIYLDGTHLPEKKWHDHFPSIYKMCIKNNIDPTKDFIPISPVQHYSCGGIQTDEFGKTNVKNLFAIGEVACTGLHGSNRLASNSLLEGLALGYFCAEEIYKSNESAWKYDESFQVSYPSAKKLDRFFLQKTMTEHVGIIKNKNGLIEAYNSLTSNYQNAPLVKNIQMKDVENEMMYNVAILLVKDALNQKKNSGVYYNENYV